MNRTLYNSKIAVVSSSETQIQQLNPIKIGGFFKFLGSCKKKNE